MRQGARPVDHVEHGVLHGARTAVAVEPDELLELAARVHQEGVDARLVFGNADHLQHRVAILLRDDFQVLDGALGFRSGLVAQQEVRSLIALPVEAGFVQVRADLVGNGDRAVGRALRRNYVDSGRAWHWTGCRQAVSETAASANKTSPDRSELRSPPHTPSQISTRCDIRQIPVLGYNRLAWRQKVLLNLSHGVARQLVHRRRTRAAP